MTSVQKSRHVYRIYDKGNDRQWVISRVRKDMCSGLEELAKELDELTDELKEWMNDVVLDLGREVWEVIDKIGNNNSTCTSTLSGFSSINVSEIKGLIEETLHVLVNVFEDKSIEFLTI